MFMGLLINGEWKTTWYEPEEDGSFKRTETRFRSRVEAGSAEGFEPELGRYHLYVSLACPWAHRTLIARSILGLEHAIGVTNVDPLMGDDGWAFGGEGDEEPLYGARFLRDIYLRADAVYTGRVTVPVLWDKKTETIVNNESREILRMFGTTFQSLATHPDALRPANGYADVDAMLDRMYQPFNNGVYRAGFATKQGAYEEAVRDVFASLDAFEAILARQRYLCGDQLTDADVAMFTTALRFAEVYYAHFKCNLRRIEDYPNVWGFVRDLYQREAIQKTCSLPQIKRHYYYSHTTLNPTRIVPLGPTLDLDRPHDRGRF